MGLFDKKYCDFCGNKIGLLGNKKLEDANMCKDCAGKLSPWFSERRHSMKADIEKQLQYREENKSAVASFKATRTLGTASTKLIIDDNARKFMVTSAKDIGAANPDVLDFSQARGCDLDVKEHRTEIRRTDSNGKSVSYVPPRYKYSYEFHAIIHVDHPYFDEMKFALSSGNIDVGEQPMNPGQTGGGWSVSRSGLNILSGSRVNDYYKCVDCGNEIKAAIDEMRTGAAPAATAAPAPQQPVQNDTSRLDALQKEVNELRQKFEAQRQTGNIDPNDTVMLQFATQQLSVEMLRNHRPGSALMGAARTELTPEDNARLDALQDEITALRHKVDVQMKQGVDARQDTERLTALTQQLSREGMRIQGFGMGMMGAAAGMQQPAPQPTPDPAPTPAPAAGSQTTCPVCGATTKVGAAGICEYCGSKIV